MDNQVKPELSDDIRTRPDHTPGPWSWEFSDAPCSRPIALAARDHDVLLASEDADGPRAYISEADRLLIEAAPDLLESLRDVVALLEMADDCRPGTDTYTAVEVAKLVIAKAMGRPTP